MKKYKKILSLIVAMAFLASTVGFAADYDFDTIMTNTRKEYNKYIDKALKEAKDSGMVVNEEKISVLLLQEPANIDDSIEADQIFVFVPEKDGKDVYGYAYYENGKSAGVAKNFDFGGNLGDVYSKEAKGLLEKTENPEEITNLLISGRLAFIAYYIDADEDYIWVYDILEESKYNVMEDEKYEISLKTLYQEEEFVKIIKAEEKAYKEYIAEKEDKKEATYKDNEDNVKEKKPKKDHDNEYDCDCDLPDCENEDCREDALEDKYDRDDDEYDCDCDLPDCENEDCREDALETKKEKKEKEEKEEKEDKNEKREKKIKELKDYKVFVGDETGNLHEDEYITRAEFAVVVCRMLDIEPEKGKLGEEFDFDDVDDKHWAKEYIKLARKSGFISGKGGNKYDPEAKISYEEALKILVSVMGYAPKAEQRGGYPYGYNKVAKELGIDKDLFFEDSKEAVRGDVMEMVHNCLDIPWMIEKVFGENMEYEIADGKNGEEKTLRIILEIKINK